MALPSDRNTREFVTFTLDASGNTAVNVFAVGTGTGTGTSTGGVTLNDKVFNAFVLSSSGAVALNFKST